MGEERGCGKKMGITSSGEGKGCAMLRGMETGNRRGYKEGISFMTVLIFFLVVLVIILLYVVLFAKTGNAGAVQLICGAEDTTRSKFAEVGTVGEVIGGIAMPVNPACGEIVNEPCIDKSNCIDQIQYRMKNVCWVRGNKGEKSGEIACLNALPIGNIVLSGITPKDICGPDGGKNLATPCKTTGPPTYGTALDTGIPNDRITWATPTMKAIENSSLSMKYVDGKIEISCISAFNECYGVPSPH